MKHDFLGIAEIEFASKTYQALPPPPKINLMAHDY
jgi:hypothetical protein